MAVGARAQRAWAAAGAAAGVAVRRDGGTPGDGDMNMRLRVAIKKDMLREF